MFSNLKLFFMKYICFCKRKYEYKKQMQEYTDEYDKIYEKLSFEELQSVIDEDIFQTIWECDKV